MSRDRRAALCLCSSRRLAATPSSHRRRSSIRRSSSTRRSNITCRRSITRRSTVGHTAYLEAEKRLPCSHALPARQAARTGIGPLGGTRLRHAAELPMTLCRLSDGRLSAAHAGFRGIPPVSAPKHACVLPPGRPHPRIAAPLPPHPLPLQLVCACGPPDLDLHDAHHCTAQVPQVQRPSNYQPPASSSAPATMAPKPPGGGPISLPPPPANAGAQFSAPAVEKKTSLYVGKIPEGQLPRLPPPASPAFRQSRRSLPWRLCQRRATGARSHTC